MHRATSACPLLADDAFDEAAHRDQCIQSALVQVPPHRFLAVVEDACSYLAGALEDICEDSITAGTLAHTIYEIDLNLFQFSCACPLRAQFRFVMLCLTLF